MSESSQPTARPSCRILIQFNLKHPSTHSFLRWIFQMAMLGAIAMPSVPAGEGPIASTDPGEALFRAGRQLLADGNTEAASRKFEEAVQASPKGPFAADALLAAATIDYPVASLDDLGRIAPERIERARTRLEAIAASHRESDSAPEAGFRLGLLRMDPANPRNNLEEARAAFLQVADFYPRASVTPEALFAAGECQLLLGGRAASAIDDTRLIVEYSSSAAAGRARLRLARTSAILGETALARSLVQPLFSVPSLHDSLAAEGRSLDSLVVRSIADNPRTPGTRALDLHFAPVISRIRSIAGLAASREGDLWVLDGEIGNVVKVPGDRAGPAAIGASPPGSPARGSSSRTPTGRAPPVAGSSPGATQTPAPPTEPFFGARGERPRGLAVDRQGGAYIWGERGILLPDGRLFEPAAPPEPGKAAELLRRITGLAIGPLGDIYVADGSRSRLLRYGPDLSFHGVVTTFEGRPTALACGEDGVLYVLIGSRRQILGISPTAAGKGAGAFGGAEAAAAISLLVLKGQDWELTSPEAIALDDLGRIYVLDGSARSVTVLDAAGRRVAQVATGREDHGELRSPTALAVDGAGNVHVADRRSGRVLRFR